MDNVFINHPTNFQFLSVCHYINSFGLFFYNLDLIPLEHRNHSTAVLNTYFEYIQKWENPTEGKLNLLQRVLKGSDLYGGGENETLDMRYVDETFQYIISNALFSHYGNIHGYLAGIINQADNITYSALKETVYRQFSKFYTSRDYCSSRNEQIQLTQLTVDKVFLENVWSMFPPTEKNLEILDVDYIYAMIGFKIAGSFQSDMEKQTFDSFITLARAVEFQTIDDERYQLALELFATPALFFYAYNMREEFQKDNTSVLIKSEKFWQGAYRTLFRFINIRVKKSIVAEIEESLHYKLEMELKKLKTPQMLAREEIGKICNYSNIEQVPPNYAALYLNTEWLLPIILPENCSKKDLIIFKILYNNHFISVMEIFTTIEENLLEQVLQNAEANILTKLDFNSTVKVAEISHFPIICTYCNSQRWRIMDEINFLFATVDQNGTKDFYALQQVNNSLTLLTSWGDERELARVIAPESSLKMETPTFYRTIKFPNESYKSFVKFVAEVKAYQFVWGLINYYQNPKSGDEKLKGYLQSMVPYYTCNVDINSRELEQSSFVCNLDVVNYLGAGKSSMLRSSFTAAVGQQSFDSMTLVDPLEPVDPIDPESSATKQIREIVTRFVSERILTKGLLNHLHLVPGTLNSGFEVSYHGYITKLLEKMIQNLSVSFRNSPEYNSLLFLKTKTTDNGIPDYTGLVPAVILDRQDNYKVVQYFYPGGSNYFGPKCLSSFGKTVQFRTIRGKLSQVPLLLMMTNSTIYHEFYPESGKIGKEEFKIADVDDIITPTAMMMTKSSNRNVFRNIIEWIPARKRMNQNEITGNLTQEVTTQTPSYIFPQVDMNRTIELFHVFVKEGLTSLFKQKDLLQFRKILNSLDSYQISQNRTKEQLPRDLWFTETINRSFIVHYLNSMKKQDFFFSDVTLLTDIEPSPIVPKSMNQSSLNTEVRYHVRFNSKYGLVDLANAFADDEIFHHQYIVSPNVDFSVTDTKFHNGNETLVMELKVKRVTKQEWLEINQRENILLNQEEIIQSKRETCIDNAALFLTLNTPRCEFRYARRILKLYVLNINNDNGTSPVPSYDDIVWDIYEGTATKVIEYYKKWRIRNNTFVNDVLYQTALYQLDNVKSAKETINNIYGGLYLQRVEPVFENYHNSDVIKSFVRFEDYFVIYSLLAGTLSSDVDAPRRVAVAIRRLALKQCDDNLSTPITIYSSAIVPKDEIGNIFARDELRFDNMLQFHSNRTIVLNNFQNATSSNVFVLYELELRNLAGIADLRAIMDDANVEYYVPEEMKIEIISGKMEVIQEREVMVVRLRNDKQPLEELMIRLVETLNEILSSGTIFYVDK